MTVCVDASLMVRYLTFEAGTERASTWLDAHGHDELIAPAFTTAEVATALPKKTRRGEISVQHCEKALDAFAGMDIRLVWDHSLVQRASELARDLDRPTAYDTLYLALAEREHCDFWITDARFARVAAPKYPFARLLD